MLISWATPARQAADGFEMFARGQPLFGELAFGDVEADADDADHFAVLIAQRNLRRADGARHARDGVETGLFEIDDRGAGFEQRLFVGIELLREFRRKEIEVGLADRVGGDRCPCCGRARCSWR